MFCRFRGGGGGGGKKLSQTIQGPKKDVPYCKGGGGGGGGAGWTEEE